jgi:acetyl esterase
MTARNPNDPQVVAYLEAAALLPRVETLTPAEARPNAERSAPLVAGPAPQLERVEDVDLGGVRARVYAPSGSSMQPAVVWFHGGGWVMGSLETHDVMCRRLAAAAGCALVAVDYRLAPEHRYPAAVDDAWSATRWIADNGSRLGLDTDRLVVGGDSAGGNLAAVVARRARDHRLGLRLQVLVYPVIDSDLETPSYRSNATGFGLTRDAMAWFWDHYAPDAERRKEPDASPLRAASLAGVAPALVVTCELDPLRDEGEAYARRLEREGVPVTLTRYDSMIHGFARMFAVMDRSHDVIRQLAGGIREAISAERVAGSGAGA